MRIKTFFLVLAVVSVVATSCQNSGIKKSSLKNAADSTSYALGILIGQQNKMSLDQVPGGDQIDVELLAGAFRLFLNGDSALMSPTEANEIVANYFQKMGDKISQENLEAGNAFLESNKAREGVVTTASGLQYEIIKAGTGAKPTADDMVKVHYHGTLIDGKVFDSSRERNEPAEFPVGGVIEGWGEVLQLMPVGSLWKVYVPANLAYGERGAGNDIGPNTTLIFEIELLEILPGENPANE